LDAVRFVEYRDYFSKDRAVGASASALVVRRESFEKVGGWEVFPGDDFDLLWKLGTTGPMVLVIEPYTTLHRAHARQTTQQTSRVLQIVSALAANERHGKYPGGRARALERRACVGGAVYYWTRLAIKRGDYRVATKFALRHYSYVLAAAAVRMNVMWSGRQPTRTLEPLDERV
jgi:hypothetical protein